MAYEINTRTNEVALVFVYGSLLSDLGNHYVLDSARFIGAATTAPVFTFYDLGAFPAAVEGGDTAILGEVYAVNDATLVSLDRLEGVPDFYSRNECDVMFTDGTEVATVNLYVLRPERVRGHDKRIVSGDWREFSEGRNKWGFDDSEDGDDETERIATECDDCGDEFAEPLTCIESTIAVCGECWDVRNPVTEGETCKNA